MTNKTTGSLNLATALLLAFSLNVKTSLADQRIKSSANMINLSPRELVDHPLRYTVIAYDNTVRQKYQTALEHMTSNQTMVYQPNISHVNEVDVLVYLLSDWSHVPMLPGHDLFAEQVPYLAALQPDRIYEFLHGTIEEDGSEGGERPFYWFFLSVGYHQNTKDWPRCFSKLTVQQVTSPLRDLAQISGEANANLFRDIDCLISE